MTDRPDNGPPEPVDQQETQTEPSELPVDAAPATESEAFANEQNHAVRAADEAIRASLVSLGFVSFDAHLADNVSADAMVSPDRRANFKRDVYVGIRDEEQATEFLGRVVEGPFHTPHEIPADSAISRTTLLYPERTRFRPTYYVVGTIEILGEIRAGERVVPTATRPRPYSEIYVYPADRLQRMLGLEGNFLLGHLMGYEHVDVKTDVDSKAFLPRNTGVFGTIGSGKSNTTQVLMEEAASAGWAVIVVDVEGEYVRMDQPTDDAALIALLCDDYSLNPGGVPDFRVYVPSTGSSDAAAPITFKVPMAGLELNVVSDILEMTEPQLRMLGTITAQAARQSAQRGGGTAARTGPLARGGAAQAPARPYTLQTLIDGLDPDQNFPLLGRTPQSAEMSTAFALRSKLISLGRSGVLDWGATAGIPELPITDLIVGGRLSVLDVSETDDRSRSIAIAYLLQALFEQVLATPRGQQMPNGGVRPPSSLLLRRFIRSYRVPTRPACAG